MATKIAEFLQNLGDYHELLLADAPKHEPEHVRVVQNTSDPGAPQVA